MRFTRKARLLAMLTATAIFFLAELLTGIFTNSMALLADSFHMLSDVISLVIAYLAVHFSNRKSKRNTYDWARAGVLGAMANAVFLIALVFTIFLSAIERIIVVETVSDPLVILGVGGAGLLINIFGLLIFGSDAHGHDHSHGHNHTHNHNHHSHSHGIKQGNHEVEVSEKSDDSDQNHSNETKELSPGEAASRLNIQAVFLHVLGDALGSVVVMISALVIYFVEEDWRFYIDPVMSLVTCFIISWTTIPLLRRTSMILLQNPPTNVDVDKMKERVLQVPGVISIHDLHVWQLSGDCAIATVHVIVKHNCNFTKIAQELKKIFHEADIHSTTIQPEFSTQSIENTPCTSSANHNSYRPAQNTCSSTPSDSGTAPMNDSDRECLLRCVSDDCSSRMCCDGVKKRQWSNGMKKSFDNPSYISIEGCNGQTLEVDVDTSA